MGHLCSGQLLFRSGNTCYPCRDSTHILFGGTGLLHPMDVMQVRLVQPLPRQKAWLTRAFHPPGRGDCSRVQTCGLSQCCTPRKDVCKSGWAREHLFLLRLPHWELIVLWVLVKSTVKEKTRAPRWSWSSGGTAALTGELDTGLRGLAPGRACAVDQSTEFCLPLPTDPRSPWHLSQHFLIFCTFIF